MPVRTSANFYRRGVPNAYNNFGYVASGNYSVGHPTGAKINYGFFNCSLMRLLCNGRSKFNPIIKYFKRL